MSRLFEKVGDKIVMDRSDPKAFQGVCEQCGKTDDLRPYGPDYSNICFDCGMLDEESAKRRFCELLDGFARGN